MKLEAGTYYMTRDKRKAFVAGSTPFKSTSDNYCVVGWIEGEWEAMSWRNNGFFFGADHNNRDLVSIWSDPPTPIEVLKEIRDCLECHRFHGHMRFEFGSVLQERMDAAIAAEEARTAGHGA